MTTSQEYREAAKTEDWAFARFTIKEALIFVQWSDSEGCWDYYIYDADETYRDGGQFETDGEGHEIENAYDALSQIAYDEFKVYDLEDDEEVEFLDPEEGMELE